MTEPDLTGEENLTDVEVGESPDGDEQDNDEEVEGAEDN